MSRGYHQAYGKPTAPPIQNYSTKNTSQYYAGGGKRNQAVAENQPQLSVWEEKMLKSSFAVFDLDNSGKISKDEFKSTLRCLGYTASDEEIDEMIVSYDSNGDGMMDYQEFLNLVRYLKDKGHKYGKEAFEQKIKKAFRVLDANGDGYLTPDELRYVLCNTGNRLSHDEIDDFIKMFDKDNDGRISSQELIAVMCCSLEDHIQKLLP